MVGRSRGPAALSQRKSLVAAVAAALLVSVAPATASGEPAPAPPAAWDLVDSPNAGQATGRLAAVDCASETDCWAVGNGWPGLVGSANMAHWTGGEWGLVPVPSVPDTMTYLYDVACPSTTECVAVGSISNPLEVFTGFVPLYMHSIVFQWDGAAWSFEEFPFPYINGHGDPATAFSLLRSVDCAAVDDCWAVGHLRQEGPHNLFMHWDGQEWTRAAVSDGLDGEPLVLGSVSCPSTAFCMAVGPFRDSFVVPSPRAPVAVSWDGNAWTLAPTPAGHPLAGEPPSNPLAYSTWLNSIDCPAANECWAVGDVDVTEGTASGVTTTLPLVDHWDGAAWVGSAVPAAPSSLPAAPGGIVSHLTAVSCSSTEDCWAVGHATSANAMPGAAGQDHVLHWDGAAWLPGPALPDPAATFDGRLAGLACPAATRCWAVGQMFPADQVHELMKAWDGTTWSSIAAPAADAAVGNYLRDVTCVSADDCWAVGMHFYGQLGRTLVQHWDGAAWSIVDSPNSAEDRYNSLRGVSCASTNDCWAVGSSGTWNMRDTQPLALHWDGSQWALSPPIPVPVEQAIKAANGQPAVYATADATLAGVHCIASNDCWAVGSVVAAAGQAGSWIVGASLNAKSLFLHWNGDAWQPVPAPATQVEHLTEYNLHDITCVSSSDCTAVGSKFARLQYNFDDLLPTEGRDMQTLVDHWDGHAWTEVASPNVSPHINELHSVSCASTSCWAVGLAYLDYAYSGSPRIAPLALHKGIDGTWQAVALPTEAGVLVGVSCVSASDCWAVGSGGAPGWYGPRSTLALHWDGDAWSTGSAPNTSNRPDKPSDNSLNGISCVAAADCWAVGQYSFGTEKRTLALRADATDCAVGGGPGCPAGGLAALAEVCLPSRSNPAPRTRDADRDHLPGLYWYGGRTVGAGADGANVAGSGGPCWFAGDLDDDATARGPVLGSLPTAGACVATDIHGQDHDGDGLPAYYGRDSRSFTISQGGVRKGHGPQSCWLAGDPDDDGFNRLSL